MYHFFPQKIVIFYVFLFFYSSALPVLWYDSKPAFHPLPTTSCREGNDEAQKKPRDSQVESPLEWPPPPPLSSVCCGFTSSFNTFQVFLSPFLPGNKNITQQLLLLVLVLVLGAGQVDFLFCWGGRLHGSRALTACCCVDSCVWLWFFALLLCVNWTFSPAGLLMFQRVHLRNTLSCLRRWSAQRKALTRWLNILKFDVCGKEKKKIKTIREQQAAWQWAS